MVAVEDSLKRLLKLCPEISLSAKDIQEIIDTKSFNGVISRYKKGESIVVPLEAVVIEEDEHEEGYCDDPYCECNSYN